MMTQEEKAKAYDEALERAKSFIENGDNVEKTVAERIFQGLIEESKDERIRKAIKGIIVEWFSRAINMFTCEVDEEELLDWLEKQKEQKPVEKIDLVSELRHHLATTPKEQLQKEWDELKKFDNVGPTVEEFLYGKPTEWNEEDEDAIEMAIIALEDMYNEDEPLTTYGGHNLPFNVAADRLKSLRHNQKIPN